MSPLSIFLVLPFVSLEYFALVSSISFTLPPGQEKCLREEVHKDVLVTGEYKLSDAPNMKTHLTVGLKTVEISALHMACGAFIFKLFPQVNLVHYVHGRSMLKGFHECTIPFNFCR